MVSLQPVQSAGSIPQPPKQAGMDSFDKKRSLRMPCSLLKGLSGHLDITPSIQMDTGHFNEKQRIFRMMNERFRKQAEGLLRLFLINLTNHGLRNAITSPSLADTFISEIVGKNTGGIDPEVARPWIDPDREPAPSTGCLHLATLPCLVRTQPDEISGDRAEATQQHRQG